MQDGLAALEKINGACCVFQEGDGYLEFLECLNRSWLIPKLYDEWKGVEQI